MAERIACKACGQWMFHLAKTCPHCGRPQELVVPVAPPPVPVARARPELTLSPDEARALLIATAPGGASEVGLADVAAEQVMPREGVAEWVLSLAAGPVTLLTVLVLGYFLLRERRSRRDEQLASVRGWAVPACTALVAALGLGSGLPTWTWLALGASFLAWVVREALRRGRAGPSLR